MLKQMRSEGIERNAITYSPAILACEKGGQGEKTLSLLTEMADIGMKPNVITYNAAISSCEKGE